VPARALGLVQTALRVENSRELTRDCRKEVFLAEFRQSFVVAAELSLRSAEVASEALDPRGRKRGGRSNNRGPELTELGLRIDLELASLLVVAAHGKESRKGAGH
jgi:hypothetical protein